MTTPYRGRGRGPGGRGRGFRSSNMLPYQESNVPLIGDWTTVYSNKGKSINTNTQQIVAIKKKEDNASSSGTKTSSYAEAMVNNQPQDQPQEYLENPVTEDIMHIDDEDLSITNDPWSIKTRYLESRGYPGKYGKSRPHLEILLQMTESVTITHHFQNNNPQSFINFSKCHINKILLPREWGLNPNGEKAIKIAENSNVYFNYWDYIQAFTKVFYYQNPKNKHSWFFSINPDIANKQIPNWFFEWWQKFGPSLEIIPKEISDYYNDWCDNSPLINKISSKNLIIGQCPCLFFIKFQIPWIWRWSLTIERNKINIPVLRRNFFYKWWNRMDPSDLKIMVNQIANTIQEDKSHKKEANLQDLSMANVKHYFQKKYPHESEEEIMVRTLDHLKTQFFNTFSVKNMETSSQGSIDPPDMDCLAGESQPEPDPEDFWDAIIQSMKGKIQN